LLVSTAFDPDSGGVHQGGRTNGGGAITRPYRIDRPGGVVPGRGRHIVEGELASAVVEQVSDMNAQESHTRGQVDLG
jgi:hypothetical protein